MFGCAEAVAAAIRAIPLPGPPLAEVLKLPEVAALVGAAQNMRDYGTVLAERKYHVSLDAALAALEAKP